MFELPASLFDRLQQAVADPSFREFVRRGVLSWCDWFSRQVKRLNRGDCFRAAMPSDDDRFRKLERIKQRLEDHPRWGPRAAVGDERLDTPAKCVLLAEWWFRRVRTRVLCPMRTPQAAPGMPCDAFEILLNTQEEEDVASRFLGIDVRIVELLNEYQAGQPGLVSPDVADEPGEQSEERKSSYSRPEIFDRDKWIYEQRQSGRTIREIQTELTNNRQEWDPLWSGNGIRDAVKRYADFEGLPRPKGRPGKPRQRRSN